MSASGGSLVGRVFPESVNGQESVVDARPPEGGYGKVPQTRRQTRRVSPTVGGNQFSEAREAPTSRQTPESQPVDGTARPPRNNPATETASAPPTRYYPGAEQDGRRGTAMSQPLRVERITTVLAVRACAGQRRVEIGSTAGFVLSMPIVIAPRTPFEERHVPCGLGGRRERRLSWFHKTCGMIMMPELVWNRMSACRRAVSAPKFARRDRPESLCRQTLTKMTLPAAPGPYPRMALMRLPPQAFLRREMKP